MADALLKLSGVHTHIGQYHILHGVDLVVPKGELTVLLGRNGAGKTTTLRTILGTVRARRGSVSFDGHRLDGLATDRIVRKATGNRLMSAQWSRFQSPQESRANLGRPQNELLRALPDEALALLLPRFPR